MTTQLLTFASITHKLVLRLGQLFSPEITAETFAEEEFHAFWWNSLR
jgi:hypothetical protein